MKKFFTLLSVALLTASVFSQTPEKMGYQAVIRDSNNALVKNIQVGMEINIRQGSPTGTIVYSETQTPTTNANGLVGIEIGGGMGFSSINWADGPFFIETKTDPTGGTDYTITGTSQLLSVPFALYAKTAESYTGAITEIDPVYLNSQAANITSTDITNLGNLSGVNTGDQDLGGLVTSTEFAAGLNVKVDKESGKSLSSNDYTNDDKTKVSNLSGVNSGDQDLSGLATKAELAIDLGGKVDTISGKGLSTNDYTDGDKTKVVGITDLGSGKIVTDEERERWNDAIPDTIRHPENGIYEGGLIGSYQTYETILMEGTASTSLKHVLVFAVPSNGIVEQRFSYLDQVETASGTTYSLEEPLRLVLTKEFDYSRKPYDQSYHINIKMFRLDGSELFSSSVSPDVPLMNNWGNLGHQVRAKLVSESTVSITIDRIGLPDNFVNFFDASVGYMPSVMVDNFSGEDTKLHLQVKNQGGSKSDFIIVIRDCSQNMDVVSATRLRLESGASADRTINLHFPKISFTDYISLWVDLKSSYGEIYDSVQVFFKRNP